MNRARVYAKSRTPAIHGHQDVSSMRYGRWMSLPVSKCSFEKLLLQTHTHKYWNIVLHVHVQYNSCSLYSIIIYNITFVSYFYFFFCSLKLPIFELLYTIRRHTAQAIGHLSLAAFPYHSLIVLLFGRLFFFLCVYFQRRNRKYKNG